MKLSHKFGVLALLGAVAALMAAPPASAGSIEDFYKGRKVTVIISTSPGGGYDAYARLVTRHMARYIPGNPTMVPKNMPGGGHAVAGQYLYNIAPKDGSVLATLGQNLPLSQVLRPKKTKFDTRKFAWIGNVNLGNNIVWAWHTTGIKTIQDVLKRELIVGATGSRSTSVMYPRALNNLIGTKFKIIIGFGGGSQINLAMERGEVGGRGSNAWASAKSRTPRYLKEKLVNIILQMGPRREKDLPDVPLITELATSEAERQVLNLISAGVAIGRPILTTPGVPPERIGALRAAFDATMKDEKFLAEAKKMRLDINPVSGVEVQKTVNDIINTPNDIVELTKAALTKGKTFKCKELVKDAKLCKKKKKKKKKKKSS